LYIAVEEWKTVQSLRALRELGGSNNLDFDLNPFPDRLRRHGMNTTVERTFIERANHWLIVAGIYLVAIACYLPAMDGKFLWDDDYYVSQNVALRKGLDGLQQLWLGVFPNPKAYPVGIQYYPVTHTSFWLQTRFHDWRNDLNPIPFHLVNVLLHATSAWLVWTILRKLRIPGALLAAGLFLLHPVQVESVAWITERKNVLSGMFALLSLLMYLQYIGFIELRKNPHAPPRTKKDGGIDFSLPPEPWKIYTLSLLPFVLGLLSKSVIGVLPAVILLIVWWRMGRVTVKDVLPLIPYFLLALAAGIWTGYFEREVIGAQGPEWAFTLTDRVALAGRAVWFYLLKLLLPVNLAFMYERWKIEAWQVIFAFAAIAIIAALFLARVKIGRGPVVLGLIFVGTLFPALGFVNYLPQRYSFVADHFQYHASIAVFIGVAYLATRYLKNAANWGFIVLVPLAGLTLMQSRIYEDRETLWKDTVRKTPSSWMAWNNLGKALLDRGALPDAEHAYQQSLDRRPDNAESIQGLGRVAEESGDLHTAFARYEQSAAVFEQMRGFTKRADANGSGPHYNMARLLTLADKKDEAIAQYRRALELNDRHVFALEALSDLLRQKGDYQGAIDAADRVLSLYPQSTTARMYLGNALYDSSKASKNEQQLKAAMDLWAEVGQMDPKDPRVPTTIGRVLAEQFRDYDRAIPYFQRALKLDPGNAAAKQNLALAMDLKRIAATQPSATQPSTVPGTMPTTIPSSVLNTNQ